jgi:hypothetical protein
VPGSALRTAAWSAMYRLPPPNDAPQGARLTEVAAAGPPTPPATVEMIPAAPGGDAAAAVGAAAAAAPHVASTAAGPSAAAPATGAPRAPLRAPAARRFTLVPLSPRKDQDGRAGLRRPARPRSQVKLYLSWLVIALAPNLVMTRMSTVPAA